jgi:hypothetical protein
MKSHWLWILPALFVSKFCSAENSIIRRDTPAPNGSYVLEIHDQIQLVDRRGLSLLTFTKNLEGVQSVDAKWSPDSRRVVVVVNYGRGSVIEAGYFDGSSWHKTLEPDTDLPVNELARQGDASGRLVAEHCLLGEWLDPDRIAVSGELIFSGQKRVLYAYTLVFTCGPTRLDPGGFEEGAIKGAGYHVR